MILVRDATFMDIALSDECRGDGRGDKRKQSTDEGCALDRFNEGR